VPDRLAAASGMSRFARASCATTKYSGKPLRPGGSPGHPRGGRWIRRCCCRRARGSLSSRYSCAARSCTSRSAVRRQARTARTVGSSRKHSTAATSVTLAICRSPVGRLLSTYGSAAFAAISQSARARPSSSKHTYWPSGTRIEHSVSARCFKPSALPSAVVRGVGTVRV